MTFILVIVLLIVIENAIQNICKTVMVNKLSDVSVEEAKKISDSVKESGE
jgi:hypothetical protein